MVRAELTASIYRKALRLRCGRDGALLYVSCLPCCTQLPNHATASLSCVLHTAARLWDA